MNGKLKYSNFHITVNFNKREHALVPSMRIATEAMVEGDYLWTWLKRYDGHQQVDFVGGDKLLVERVRLRAAFEERGEHNKGVHVHILVEVAHRTMVQVSKQGVELVFREFVGHTPNVHCRFIRGSGDDKDFILHYITKEVPRHPAKGANQRLMRAMQQSAPSQLLDAEY